MCRAIKRAGGIPAITGLASNRAEGTILRCNIEVPMGRLSTHVLDTAHGRPGAGMRLTLYRVEGEGRLALIQAVTNADGRTDAPLLAGETFAPGRYQLAFQVGDYFRALGVPLPEPAFLDEVTLSFGMEADGHYHVPLLVSPYGYSTYRGS